MGSTLQNLFKYIKFTISRTPPFYFGIIRSGLTNFMQVACLIALDSKYFYLSAFQDYSYELSNLYYFIKNGLLVCENLGTTPHSMLSNVTQLVLIFFQNYRLFLTF